MSYPDEPVSASKNRLVVGRATTELCSMTLLRIAGLRATEPRIRIAAKLFGQRHRHFTPEALFHEFPVEDRPSLATIYNTIRTFVGVGLIKQISVSGFPAHFDTNTAPHAHYYLDGESRFVDAADETQNGYIQAMDRDGFDTGDADLVVRVRKR